MEKNQLQTKQTAGRTSKKQLLKKELIGLDFLKKLQVTQLKIS